MTSLVGILCRNGVVIGSDSAATLGPDPRIPTVEVPTKKLDTFGDGAILAGTGPIGLNQRFSAIIKDCWEEKEFSGKNGLAIGKMLAAKTIKDFASTHVKQGQYGALVGYVASGQPILCEFPQHDFQPELKELDKLWFASMGSAQTITDAFLVFLRNLFWKNDPPLLDQGVFMALVALQHAIRVNPGGVNGPIQLAVLEARKPGQFRARHLGEDEIDEHLSVVREAHEHFAQYADRWSVSGAKEKIPEP